MKLSPVRLRSGISGIPVRSVLRILLAAGLGTSLTSAGETADAWWLWLPGRAEARAVSGTLRPEERIYWHTATMSWTGNAWQDTEHPEPPPARNQAKPPVPSDPSSPASPPAAPVSTSLPGQGRGAEIVPVLRLQSAGAVEVDAAWPPVLERLREMRARFGGEWLQLDCDCPDRLLALYAQRLQALRRELAPVKLSVTALAGWAPQLDPAVWKTAADELTPMFYDLEPDHPDQILSGRIRPLVEPEACARWLPAWRALGIPWRCGLANFRRLSRFKADGTPLGHFPSWDAAALLVPGAGNGLRAPEPAGPGAWRWQVLNQVRLSGTRGAAAGDWLVFREPDPGALTRLETAALAAGAQGVVWFSRPTGRVTDGWSAAYLWHRKQPSPPTAELRREGNAFTLTAGAGADFPPFAEGGFGWVLEVRGTGPVPWETSGGGDFAFVSAAGPVSGSPEADGPGLIWTFPGLTAGASLHSAPVHGLAGGVTAASGPGSAPAAPPLARPAVETPSTPAAPACPPATSAAAPASAPSLRWRIRPVSPQLPAAGDGGAKPASAGGSDSRFPWRRLQ